MVRVGEVSNRSHSNRSYKNISSLKSRANAGGEFRKSAYLDGFEWIGLRSGVDFDDDHFGIFTFGNFEETLSSLHITNGRDESIIWERDIMVEHSSADT